MKPLSITGVKILGRAIGTARNVKPSEFDGDGDGFLTGPDGRDNIPAPKRVVEAAKKAGRVADILKPTDDLMEARKSGRPWKPLVFNSLPDDFKNDFYKLYDDAARHMHANGKKWRKIEAELVEKYGGPKGQRITNETFGQVTDWAKENVPEDALVEYFDVFNKYLLRSYAGKVYEDNDRLARRISELDNRYQKILLDAFDEQRKKAFNDGNGSQFDKHFKGFGEFLKDTRNVDLVSAMLQSQGSNSVISRAHTMGYEGIPWEDQFRKADREAKNLMNNPKKRVAVFIDSSMLGQILDDKRMKNFFEAKRNVFNDEYDELAKNDKWGAAERRKSYMNGRLNGERMINGIPVKGALGKNRPIYGMVFPDGFHALDDTKDDEPLAYGDVAVVMRHSVEERTTFTAADGLNFRFVGSSPVNEPSAISMVPQKTLAFNADDRRKRMKGDVGGSFDYIEAQISGGVSLDDIAYISVMKEDALPSEIKQRLKDMGIPVVVNSSTDLFEEPIELAQKQEDKSTGYSLFAVWGNRKLFVPSVKPDDGDLHGMISIANGKKKRVENVMSLMKFGNWELV